MVPENVTVMPRAPTPPGGDAVRREARRRCTQGSSLENLTADLRGSPEGQHTRCRRRRSEGLCRTGAGSSCCSPDLPRRREARQASPRFWRASRSTTARRPRRRSPLRGRRCLRPDHRRGGPCRARAEHGRRRRRCGRDAPLQRALRDCVEAGDSEARHRTTWFASSPTTSTCSVAWPAAIRSRPSTTRATATTSTSCCSPRSPRTAETYKATIATSRPTTAAVDYYDPNGRSSRKFLVRSPMLNFKITSGFRHPLPPDPRLHAPAHRHRLRRADRIADLRLRQRHDRAGGLGVRGYGPPHRDPARQRLHDDLQSPLRLRTRYHRGRARAPGPDDRLSSASPGSRPALTCTMRCSSTAISSTL